MYQQQDYTSLGELTNEAKGQYTQLNEKFMESQLYLFAHSLLSKSPEFLRTKLEKLLEGGYDPVEVEDLIKSRNERKIVKAVSNDWLNAVSGPDSKITIWDLENGKEDSTVEFDTSRGALPIIVTRNALTSNTGLRYYLDLDEETMAGLLFALRGRGNFKFYSGDVLEVGVPEFEITLDILKDHYTKVPTEYYPKKYSTQINGIPVYFDTTNFIRGVKTAASWLNIDPHTMVDVIMEGDRRYTY